MTRGTWVVVALAMTAVLAGCSTRDQDEVAGVRAPTKAHTPLASATAAPGAPRIMSPITEADVAFTHPVDRDGRTWWPVAGYQGGIIFDSERPVLPEPGDPIPQAPARFDQQFWLWDAAAGAWAGLWANESTRHESVIGVDGEWALSLLYRNNPGDEWILRLHNLVSGDTRDVDNLDPAATGIDAMGASIPAIGDGSVAYVHKVPAEGEELVERLELYDIGSSTTTTIVEAPAEGWPVVMNANPSLGGGRLGWMRRAPAGSTSELLIQDLATGRRETIPSSGDESWFRLTADGRHILGQGRLPADSTKPRDLYARDLLTGESVKYLTAVAWGVVAADQNVSWWGAGGPGDPRGYYDTSRNELHLLDPGINAWGQSGTILAGWFFWVEGTVRESAADADTRVFHFVPIP